MILVGNQRVGAKDLALHLLKEGNERVDVHELRGFASDNLMGALNEAYTISRATRCKQFLFSMSFNPPLGAKVSNQAFHEAINEAEDRLNLKNQPRVIVFHEKNGRRHCHVVWSRIKTEEMKAVQLSFTKRKLNVLSRELYLKHGWTMPAGLVQSEGKDPRNFTLAEWQQAKRIGKDPRAIKAVFQDCWAISDTQSAFAQALEERSYRLAKGERRGIVAVDHRGEVFAISKWVGIKAKEVRAKITDDKSLPLLQQVKANIAEDMTEHLNQLAKEQKTRFQGRIAELKTKARRLRKSHAAEKEQLFEHQQTEWKQHVSLWDDRFNTGLRGLIDRFTGKHRRIQRQNESEAQQIKQRQLQEGARLLADQKNSQSRLQSRINRLESLKLQRSAELRRDTTQYKYLREQRVEQIKTERKQKPQNTSRPPKKTWVRANFMTVLQLFSTNESGHDMTEHLQRFNSPN